MGYLFCIYLFSVVDCVVVLVDYRLVLEYKFLVFLNDVIIVYVWVWNNIVELGGMLENVLVVGVLMGVNFVVVIC